MKASRILILSIVGMVTVVTMTLLFINQPWLAALACLLSVGLVEGLSLAAISKIADEARQP